MCKVDCWEGPPERVGTLEGPEHTRLEQKFRIITQRPLPDKSYQPVSADEDRRIQLD